MLEGCTQWPPETAEAYRGAGYWKGLTIWGVMAQVAGKYADRTAIVAGSRRFTYRELQRNVETLSERLLGLGFQRGERVIFQLPNSAEHLFTFLALMRIGVIPVMALPAHRQNEVRSFIKLAEARAYFIPERIRNFDFRVMADEMRAEQASLEQVFVLGEPGREQTSLAELLADTPPEAAPAEVPSPGPQDVALMLLSGGTTALPKLIPRTHDDYVYNFTTAGQRGGIREGTVYMAVLPISHNYTLGCPGVLATLLNGGKVVIADGFDAETVFPLVEQEGVEVIAAGVPLLNGWLNSGTPRRHDLSSLRVVSSGGARLPPELRRRTEEAFGCTMQEIFGTGEGLLCFNPLDAPETVRHFASGRPMSPGDEIRVVDDDGNEAAEGEPGELLVRGPYTIRGYYKAPDKNAEAFTPDGYYRTGDVVRCKEGLIYCEGRKKDQINRGGEKISCDEIEDILIQHGKIKNVSLVAMPDEVYGERACAFVILNAGETLELEEVTAFLLKHQIAKFKLPERLEVVESFPISPAGKILKRAMRDSLFEQHAGPS